MEVLDCVEVIVEKETYAREGVHLGMQGWICFEQCTEGYWLVNFPQYGEKDDIAEISIKEEDLKLIPVMNAIVNEHRRPSALPFFPAPQEAWRRDCGQNRWKCGEAH